MPLSDWFFDLPAELLTALGTVLGFALTYPLTYAQQNSLGNWLELIGQILDTSAAQGQLLQQQQQSDQQSQRLDALERELADLRRELRRLSRPDEPNGGKQSY